MSHSPEGFNHTHNIQFCYAHTENKMADIATTQKEKQTYVYITKTTLSLSLSVIIVGCFKKGIFNWHLKALRYFKKLHWSVLFF